MKHLRKSDILHVHSLDRLARNLEDLLNIVREMTSSGVSIKFHKNNMYLTGNDEDAGSKFMLHMLGAVAELERSMIKER